MSFTWELVVLLIGALTAFLAFLTNMLKKPNTPKDSIEKDTAVLREQVSSIRNEVTDIKSDLSTMDERTQRRLERFEDKIEKFTDVVIEIITDHHSRK